MTAPPRCSSASVGLPSLLLIVLGEVRGEVVRIDELVEDSQFGRLVVRLVRREQLLAEHPILRVEELRGGQHGMRVVLLLVVRADGPTKLRLRARHHERRER